MWALHACVKRVAGLAELFPNDAWAHYMQTGWATVDLGLSKEEKRLLKVCTRCHLADMGVNPLRADTYDAAQAMVGFDNNYGWYRNPAMTHNQFYLGTPARSWPRLGRGTPSCCRLLRCLEAPGCSADPSGSNALCLTSQPLAAKAHIQQW